jgi:hypothetical protein
VKKEERSKKKDKKFNLILISLLQRSDLKSYSEAVFLSFWGVPAEQNPIPKDDISRRQAIRYKSSLRCGLFAAILHAK